MGSGGGLVARGVGVGVTSGVGVGVDVASGGKPVATAEVTTAPGGVPVSAPATAVGVSTPLSESPPNQSQPASRDKHSNSTNP